jgi:thioredoxin-like negative regulator of GroEL
MTTFPGARSVRGAVAAALVALAVPALGDDLQDATRLFKAGQPQQALERVNKALAAKPRDPQARFLKGLILAEQGNTKEASEIFLRLTQDYPELPEPYNNLAVIYAAQGQYDKARAALEQSIRTHPSYATAYENLGDVYAKLASQAYDKALQIDSANPGAKNKLALVRELVGGTPRAVHAAAADKAPAKPAVIAAAAPAAEAKPAAPAMAAAGKPAAAKPAAENSAAAKPAAEKSAAQKPAARPADAEVLETVNAWAKAWAAKDIEGYLAFYARDFQTPNGEARSEWEKGRRQRVGAPKSISVSVEAPRVSLSGETQASVTFRQHYRSDLVKSSGTKTLVMVKSDGRWFIRQEKVAN